MSTAQALNKFKNFYPVREIEIGLINNCNLACPLCTRQMKIFDDCLKYQGKYEICMNTLLNFLDRLEDLSIVNLVGSVSEPMIYKDIVLLCKYLKKRNIAINISTNGSLGKKSTWHSLGSVLDDSDNIIFAIDGSTQELHSINRINSNLNSVLENQGIIRQYSVQTTLQFILFDHNKTDISNIEKIYKNYKFTHLDIQHCYSVSPDKYAQPPILKPISLINNLYSTLKHRSGDISCEARVDHQSIYMNHMGEVMPCCHINEYVCSSNNKYLNIYDDSFNSIMENIFSVTALKTEHPCNKFCNTLNKKIFSAFNIDP